jgi:transcriptional regulator with XRE-family HTH domain
VDIKEIQKILTERLLDLMSEKEIKNAYALSKVLHIPNRTIYSWLNGEKVPRIDYVIKLAKFFNVPTDYLLGVKDEPW